ncbi:MAG: hypothetical protein ACI9EH_000493, partial [Planktomarina sp.]
CAVSTQKIDFHNFKLPVVCTTTVLQNIVSTSPFYGLKIKIICGDIY